MKKFLTGLMGLGFCCAVNAAETDQALRDFGTNSASPAPVADIRSTLGADLEEGPVATQRLDEQAAQRDSSDGVVAGPGASLMLMVTPATDPTVDSTWTLSGSATAVVDPGNTPRFNVGAGVDLLDVDVWLDGGDLTSGTAVNDNEAAILSGSGSITIPSAGTFDVIIAYLDIDATATGDDLGIALDNATMVPFINGDVISWTGSFTTAIPFQDYNPGTYNFAVFGNGSEIGMIPLTVEVAAVPGACCIDGSTCTDGLLASECVDAGGVWQGVQSMCVDAQAAGLCVDAPVCPPGAIIDNDGAACGQPAPDNINAGCASPSGAFQFLSGDGCGSVVCGESSADSRNMGNRDTDWYFFTPIETTEYTACVTAQFFPQVQFWPLNPGIDPCLGVVPGNAAVGAPGETICATACLLGNNPVAIRVTTVDANGNPQRDGVGCVDYLLEVTCDECVLGACCGSDNVCTENQTEADCLAAAGEYLGDNSTCADVAACGGACCNQDGSCSDGISRLNCINVGGDYNGIESICADVEPCPECVFEDPNDLDGLAGMDEDCTILGVDLVNSGCTAMAAGTDFSLIDCGETVCGITAFDGGTRDLDWYHFTIAQEEEVLVEVNNQMATGNPLLFRLQWRTTQMGVPACDGGFNVLTPSAQGDALPPGSTFFSFVLPASRYTLLVAYDFANQTSLPPECPNGGRYRLSITCNDTCTFTCADTEGEPDCGDVNEINDGCSVTPTGAFSPLSLNSKVCGSTQILQVDDGMGGFTATRDTDWWQFNIPTTGDYDFSLQAEFEALWTLQPLDGPGGCADPATFSFRVFQCGDVTITVEDLDAGNYALFIAPDFFSYVWYLPVPFPASQELCGSAYSMEVSDGGGDPCAGNVCADSNCDGSVTVSDIGFFVTAVANGEAAWNASFPGGTAPCDFTCVNDTNGDGFVTVSDIGLFVTAVTMGGCP